MVALETSLFAVSFLVISPQPPASSSSHRNQHTTMKTHALPYHRSPSRARPTPRPRARWLIGVVIGAVFLLWVCPPGDNNALRDMRILTIEAFLNLVRCYHIASAFKASSVSQMFYRHLPCHGASLPRNSRKATTRGVRTATKQSRKSSGC